MNGTIKMYGGATFDYAIIQKSNYALSEITFDDPHWGIETQFRVSFTDEENPLAAGNAMSGDSKPDKYDIYRSKNGEDLVLAGTANADSRVFNDFNVTSNAYYNYSIYPSAESEYIGTSITTSQSFTPSWNMWYLFVCEETGEENSFVVDEIYVFEFDIKDIQLTNNTTANRIITFGRYPIVQKDLVNAWSGTLSSLIGFIDCSGDEQYFETPSMTDAVRELSTDLRPKFLRDMEGHIYRVEVCSPISWSQEYYLNGNKTTKSLEWIEIGEVGNTKITGTLLDPASVYLEA